MILTEPFQETSIIDLSKKINDWAIENDFKIVDIHLQSLSSEVTGAHYALVAYDNGKSPSKTKEEGD